MGRIDVQQKTRKENMVPMVCTPAERGDGGLVLGASWPKAQMETLPRLQYSLHPNHGTILEAVLEPES